MSKEYIVQENTLKSIADAIRKKSKTTDKIKVKDMPQRIQSLATSGNDFYNCIYGESEAKNG